MKYKKDSFIVIPNKEAISGQKPDVQAVYFWICNFANKDGSCFPSVATLSKNSGVSRRRIFQCIQELETIGVITKETRKKGKENLTNVYQIMIVDVGGGAGHALPSADGALGGSASHAQRTQLNSELNKPNKEGDETSPSDVKVFIDFFFNASQKIQGVKPMIAGGKEGMLIKNKLKHYNLERLQKLAVWYLSDRKQVKNQRNGEFEWRYRYAPSISAMMSSAFFNDILKEEHNPEFLRRFSDIAPRIFGRSPMADKIDQLKRETFGKMTVPK
jgi:hypothetical protein